MLERYDEEVIDNFSLDAYSGSSLLVIANSEYMIITTDGEEENRRVIISADNDRGIESAVKELENLFDGKPKLNLREVK